jgi:hypothetical protein
MVTGGILKFIGFEFGYWIVFVAGLILMAFVLFLILLIVLSPIFNPKKNKK